MTGLTPHTHGRIGYQDQVPWRYAEMLPAVLSRAGYQTACIGKRHFFPEQNSGGFEYFESAEDWRRFDPDYRDSYEEWLKEQTGGKLNEQMHGVDCNSWYARPSHLPEELHINTWTVTRAIEFLRRRDTTRPFFLNVSFVRPHPPYDPPQVFWDMYRDRPLSPVPVGDWVTGEEDHPVSDINAATGRLPAHLLARTRRAYYAQIAHIDNQIGRLLIAMRMLKIPLPDIVFTSDHGEMLGDHCHFRKSLPYEGAARIPLIITPATGGEGKAVNRPVAIEDVYPTLLEMAGDEVPSRTQGLSLLPLCRDSGAPDWREFVHGEHTWEHGATQFLTDGKEKYIWYVATGREQLFDLESDPWECRDLACDPARRASLACWRGRLAEYLCIRGDRQFSDGIRLYPGKPLPASLPWAETGSHH
jgi:arylsulfatase A-like enzyme